MSNDDKQLTEITIKVKRVPAVVFGIIGIILSTILAFALVIYSNQIIGNIVVEITDYQSLLIVATSLVVAAAAFIILTILFISIVSILGHFNKGLRLVLFLFLVLAIMLLLAAAIVGAVWMFLPR
jgi:hypothetical protein